MNDELIQKYLDHLKFKGRCPVYIDNRQTCLYRFKRYLREALSIERFQDVDKASLRKYLDSQRQRLKDITFSGRVSVLRCFFAFLKKKRIIFADPMEELDLHVSRDRSPRNVPDEKTMEWLLEKPDTHTYIGIRDKAMLELLYSTGIRCRELLNLKTGDVDLKENFLCVYCGKGNKDRMVPFGEKAKNALKVYLEITRPHFQRPDSGDHLFLSEPGNPIREWAVHEIIKRHGDQSSATKRITAHGIRHACALHMLKAGAPIEAVQELLGHKNISTTQIYTRLSPKDLKTVHEKYHPRLK